MPCQVNMAAEPVIDTDVIVRLLTGDEPAKQRAAFDLFNRIRAGELTAEAPQTVIADAVFVLTSPRLYRVTRANVRALLLPIVTLPGFRIEDRDTVLAALDLYATSASGFGDALIVAYMRQRGSTTLYSYDAGFDRYPDIQRREP